MKLLTSSLLTTFVGAACAASEARVYLFQGDESPIPSNPPSLSPEQARLVFAQRLGVSQYHGLGDASKSTLSYINKYGGQQDSLFHDSTKQKVTELVLIIEGVSAKTAQPLLDAWSSIKPTFTIANPPSMEVNQKLGTDLRHQAGQDYQCPLEDAINPFESRCWNAKSKLIHVDLLKSSYPIERIMAAQERLIRFAKQEAMNVLMVLMPESSRASKTEWKAYGSYEMPSQNYVARRQTEEPMTDLPTVPSPSAIDLKQYQPSNATDNSKNEPITGIPPLCHTSLDSCISNTNNCSGHGECYKKRGGKSSCFTCGCVPQKETFLHGDAKDPKTGHRITYWGGAACQKKDISGPFWIITIFSIVAVGLVSWSIGLLFSIGEEKLPGVIGAGVSSNRGK